MTANLALSYPNFLNVGSPATYGGSWLAAAPLTKVLSLPISQVARSSTTSTTDTIIGIDLISPRTMQCFSLINHNLSGSDTWKIKLGTTSGGSDVYSGSWSNVAQLNQYHEPLIWSDEDLGFAYDTVLILPAAYSARYLTIEISSVGNPAGYVQVGRVFAGPMWQPTINAAYGLQDFVKDMSTTTRAESGTRWITERRRTRGVKCALEWLTPSEAEWFHEFMMSAGTCKEVMYMPKATDLAYCQRYGFVGVMSELSAIDYPYFNTRATGVQIESLT